MNNSTAPKQTRFEGTIDERVETRHKGSGVLECTDIVPVVSRIPIVATCVEVAHFNLITAAIAARKADPDNKAPINLKMLDIVCDPFQSRKRD
jgi:hypothetical protein